MRSVPLRGSAFVAVQCLIALACFWTIIVPAASPALAGPCALTVTPAQVQPGGRILVKLSDCESENRSAWIAFYREDAANDDYITYTFLNNLTAGTYDAVVPGEAGRYNFRVFADEGYEPAAVSDTIVVNDSGVAQVEQPAAPAEKPASFRVEAAPTEAPAAGAAAPVTDAAVAISAVQASPVFFSPAAAGPTIRFTVDKPCKAAVTFHPLVATAQLEGGVAISFLTNVTLASVTKSCQAGECSVTWDGRDASGQPVTNQMVAFRIAAGTGTPYFPDYKPGPVAFSNVVAATSVCFQANEQLQISYSLQAPAFVMLAVPRRPYPVVWGEPRKGGDNVEFFNGRSQADGTLLSGPYGFSLYTQVLPENALVIERPARGTLVEDLQAEAYLIHPSQSEVTEIHYQIKKPSTVQVQLKDPQGNQITVVNGESQTAGAHKVEWQGHNNSNLMVSAEGDYEVSLQALDAATGETEQRSANVTVRR